MSESEDTQSEDAQSGDADRGMSVGSAKQSDETGVKPALNSGRGHERGVQDQRAPGPESTPEQIRLYLFAQGLTAEDMEKTEEHFETFEIVDLANFSRCLRSGKSYR